MVIENQVSFVCLRGFIHVKDVNKSFFFFTQDFQQHVRTRSDPGIHEGDVHYERI